MEILPATEEGIARALEILRGGGIVAHATETCYGFACDVADLGAMCNLFILKHRPFDQPVSILFPSLDEAKEYVKWNDEAEALARKHLPGPLTLILPRRMDIPVHIYTQPSVFQSTSQPINQSTKKQRNEQQETIGIRISSHPLAQRLVTAFGKPLSTTSANLHGLANPYSPGEIAAQFKDQAIRPDLILDAGELPRTPPSTVMDLAGGKGVRRKGGI